MKAKLYEALSRDRSTIGDDLLAAASLVDFEKKNIEDIQNARDRTYYNDSDSDTGRKRYDSDEDDIELTTSEHPGRGWLVLPSSHHR